MKKENDVFALSVNGVLHSIKQIYVVQLKKTMKRDVWIESFALYLDMFVQINYYLSLSIIINYSLINYMDISYSYIDIFFLKF